MVTGRLTLQLCGVAGAFALGFGAVRLAAGARSSVSLRAGHPILDSLLDRPPGPAISQVLLFYVGSSTCVWCNDKRLPLAVQTVVDSIRARAALAGLDVETVGIDLDPLRSARTKHLDRIGSFGQVALGGGVVNWPAADLSWVLFGGTLGTPQVVLALRSVAKQSAKGQPLMLVLGRPQMLARKVGVYEILEWARHGAPTPALQLARQE